MNYTAKFMLETRPRLLNMVVHGTEWSYFKGKTYLINQRYLYGDMNLPSHALVKCGCMCVSADWVTAGFENYIITSSEIGVSFAGR